MIILFQIESEMMLEYDTYVHDIIETYGIMEWPTSTISAIEVLMANLFNEAILVNVLDPEQPISVDVDRHVEKYMSDTIDIINDDDQLDCMVCSDNMLAMLIQTNMNKYSTTESLVRALSTILGDALGKVNFPDTIVDVESAVERMLTPVRDVKVNVDKGKLSIYTF